MSITDRLSLPAQVSMRQSDLGRKSERTIVKRSSSVKAWIVKCELQVESFPVLSALVLGFSGVDRNGYLVSLYRCQIAHPRQLL
jgi:hypothetical protein